MVLDTRPLNIFHYTHGWCYKIHSSILASKMSSISYLSLKRTVSLSLTGLNIFDQGPWKELQDRTGSGRGNIHLTRLFEVLKQTVFSSKACGTVVNCTKFEFETFTMEHIIISPAHCRGGRAEFWNSNAVQNAFS